MCKTTGINIGKKWKWAAYGQNNRKGHRKNIRNGVMERNGVGMEDVQNNRKWRDGKE